MVRDLARDNRETAGLWLEYRNHRERVMKHLLNAARSGCQSVLIAGAGNCNDLDLNELRAHFETITLVDPDRAALEAGVGRQHFSGRASLIFQPFETLALGTNGEQADLVVSACVLSQLLIDVDRHDQSSARELMSRHASALSRVARRQVLLISDCAVIASGAASLPNNCEPCIFSWIELNGRFFDHLMPHNMLRAIHSPEVASRFAPPELYGVWLWEQGSACLATLALGFCRREHLH